MARKNRPKSPDQIAADKLAKRALDLEAVNLPGHIAGLPAHETVEVVRKGDRRYDTQGNVKVADVDSARRMDVFSALKDGMVVGAYDAVRRFETALMIRRGEAGRGQNMERVDEGHDPDTLKGTTIAMIVAAQEIEGIVARLPPRDWWLLMELIAPSREYDGWRGVVAFITGETHTHAQGAVVRAVCVNVRDAYLAWERKAAA